jgi:hypothetical protein
MSRRLVPLCLGRDYGWGCPCTESLWKLWFLWDTMHFPVASIMLARDQNSKKVELRLLLFPFFKWPIQIESRDMFGVTYILYSSHLFQTKRSFKSGRSRRDDLDKIGLSYFINTFTEVRKNQKEIKLRIRALLENVIEPWKLTKNTHED